MNFIDAYDMAQAVRKKHVSAQELVEDSIQRIEEKNPQLHAVVSTRFDNALKEAQELKVTDQPFAGVPILLKDLGQNQEGELSTSGSRLFKDYRASHSDYYVTRLQELGFIVLGRTSTPEFGFKNISDSQLHGPVNLPFDRARNAGGSSGGAAAAVSSGMVPIAGASDGGGSIRIPASFNGLIGLKPTRGRIPVGPVSYRGWQGASVNFALTKTVRDTKHLLYHFQTCQMESPFICPTLSKESLLETKLPSTLRIAYSLDSPIDCPVSSDARAAMAKTITFLEQKGHELIELAQQPLDGIDLMKNYYIMNSVETAAMFDEIQASLGRSLRPEDMEVMTWGIYQSGLKILGKDYSAALQKWDSYSHQMALFHQKYDLYLTPATNKVAPLHGEFAIGQTLQDKLRNMDQFSVLEQQDIIWEMFEKPMDCTPYTPHANLTGQPAISLPVYKNPQGLPLGVQFTAAKGREDLLLQLAQVFEDQGEFVL